jgi:hypothetical protein
LAKNNEINKRQGAAMIHNNGAIIEIDNLSIVKYEIARKLIFRARTTVNSIFNI